MKRTICVCSDGFPYGNNSEFSFVKELCVELVRQQVDVIVISPQSLIGTLFRRKALAPFYYEERLNEGGYIKVYRPVSWSLGNRFPKYQYKTNSWSISKLIRKKNLSFDVFYGHFWHCALQLYPIARKQMKPLFVATGESHIFLADDYDSAKIRPFLDYVSKVICVSSKNKDESVSLGYCNKDKCIVLPNGVDSKKFYPSDHKQELRKLYKFPDNVFLVAFTGAFIERKGADRVSAAIKQIGDSSIKGIFIGKPQEGNVPHEPDLETAIYIGYVPHDNLRDMLCCADVFVLPTYKEGCCNAIIEAMACGLPIISSNRSFNSDILDDSNSIVIDPTNINEIARAIEIIKKDTILRKKLCDGAISKAKQLSIEKRATAIKSLLFNNIE